MKSLYTFIFGFSKELPLGERIQQVKHQRSILENIYEYLDRDEKRNLFTKATPDGKTLFEAVADLLQHSEEQQIELLTAAERMDGRPINSRLSIWAIDKIFVTAMAELAIHLGQMGRELPVSGYLFDAHVDKPIRGKSVFPEYVHVEGEGEKIESDNYSELCLFGDIGNLIVINDVPGENILQQSAPSSDVVEAGGGGASVTTTPVKAPVIVGVPSPRTPENSTLIDDYNVFTSGKSPG